MTKWIFLFLLAAVGMPAPAAEPVHVIITAGQSNTDGRVPNTCLPAYIKSLATDTVTYAEGAYRYCRIAQNDAEGKFVPFWPQASRNHESLWAFDAVTYYALEQRWQEPFYVIKWAVGGTSIAPKGDSPCWSADAGWLAQTRATFEGGQSLLLSFLHEIDVCIDQTLSRLEGGYRIDAFLWHQGEADQANGKAYFDNLKSVVNHVRAHLTEKTGRDYSRLPFLFGTVARSNQSFDNEVEDAMWRLANEDPDMYLVDMSEAELLEDRWHFTAASAEYLGRQMYRQLEQLLPRTTRP